MTDSVEKQYTNWIYPPPTFNIRETWQNGDPSFQQLHYVYWPDRAYWPGIRILVAGCGSIQAAQIADRNPTAHVFGIDISATSLAHESALKEKFALTNLTLERISIQESESVGQQFDLILATGVLHHQKDPVAALAALGRQLAPSGVIAVMVYGKYFRTGVYMLQDLFRRIGLGQNAEDVAVVRQTLDTIPQYHLVRNYVSSAPDLHSDSGIVDTFLHTVDRAYTVTECMHLVEEAGLRFQRWVDNFLYFPNGLLNTDHPLFKRLEKLPEHEMNAAMELYNGGIGTHHFICCRTDRSKAEFQLHFETDRFFDLVPIRRAGQLEQSNAAGESPTATLVVRAQKSHLTNAQLRLLQNVDGQRSVQRCIADSGLPLDERSRTFAKNFFVSLWRLDVVTLRH